MLLEGVDQFITTHSIRNANVLLAVSGGLDSVVLAHLMQAADIRFAIAHCNFQLRGKESDEDATFVKRLAASYKVKYHEKKFNTEEFADIHKLSVQEAARDLRYFWFNELAKEFSYDYIATAHHSDDSIETLFINLSRGTGIRGLKGINKKTDSIIRPLHFATRSDLEEYAMEHNIVYREDSSNREDKYLRNRIRHHIIPEFESYRADFKSRMMDNLENINESLELFEMLLNEKLEGFIEEHKGVYRIDKYQCQLLCKQYPIQYEIFSRFGFNQDQIKSILNVMGDVSGKRFYSDRYELLIDREYLMIRPISEQDDKTYSIQRDLKKLDEPIRLIFERIHKKVKPEPDSDIAFIDYDKLEFPLRIRKWKKGDKFKPLGMKTFKKLSDFFIDEKLSLFEKENCWLLLSGNDIVWVIGHRIDDRYKITDETIQVLKCNFS